MYSVRIDVSNMFNPKFTGVAVYVDGLIKALKQQNALQISGYVKLSRLRHARAIYKNTGLPLTQKFSDIFTRKKHIFHGPDFWVPPSTHNRLTVLTIHDLSVFNPDFWSPERVKTGTLRLKNIIEKDQPTAIICVSEFIKNELLTHFPALRNKIHTVYHGADHIVQRAPIHLNSDFTENFGKRPYILYLGTIEYRKNIASLIQSYLQSGLAKEVDLVLAGSSHGYGGESIVRQFNHPIKHKGVRFLGYVSDTLRQQLLKNALFTVYPSLYEGFGFPILESMKAGTPVLTSDFGAMKEIAADAAYVTDTKNLDAFARGLSTLVHDFTLRKILTEKGLLRAAEFTWARCASDTIRIYDSIWHE